MTQTRHEIVPQAYLGYTPLAPGGNYGFGLEYRLNMVPERKFEFIAGLRGDYTHGVLDKISMSRFHVGPVLGLSVSLYNHDSGDFRLLLSAKGAALPGGSLSPTKDPIFSLAAIGGLTAYVGDLVEFGPTFTYAAGFSKKSPAEVMLGGLVAFHFNLDSLKIPDFGY